MNRILKIIDITTITLSRALTIIGIALGMALAIVLVYLFSHRKTGWNPSVALTIFILCPVVSVIVVCIGSNIARAISIGGGLALIRFRNTVEDPQDLIYIFLSLAAGMACGVGFVGFSAIAIGLILLVLFLLSLCGLDRFGGRGRRLRILVPESLDYVGVFDPVLKKFCRSFHLNRVRTQDYGTLLELDYRIVLRNAKNEKEMLDEIRTRNGNLNISLVDTATESHMS